MPPLILFAALLLALALFLLWYAQRSQREAGIPGGRIIYTDTSGWKPVEKPLYDAAAGLTGRPDYLVQKGGLVIPVEVKSSRVAAAPYDGHIYQLAAYCYLVEREFGVRPPYGILHYPNRTFSIDYTAELENALLDLLEEMRRQERRKEVHRSHDNTLLCRGCGYRADCGEALR